jgi:FkbM family methyltransferase
LFSIDDFYSKIWFSTRCTEKRTHEENVIKLLEKDLVTSKCFVDVGAHIGYYSFLASKLMPNGIVYAFEMDEYNYNLLKKNTEINELKNLNIFHVAVTDSPGKVHYIRKSKHPSPMKTLSLNDSQSKFGQTMSIQGITLDSFFKDKPLNPDVIKIDVEGAEMNVLKGMQNILKSENIKLFIEIHPVRLLLNFKSSTNELISMLIEKGFNVFEIKNMRKHGKDIKLRKLNEESKLPLNAMIYAYK